MTKNAVDLCGSPTNPLGNSLNTAARRLPLMVKARPAAGGGRWVEISPERLRGWLDGFYGRHDGATEDGLTLTGTSNGDTATLHPPPGLGAPADLDALLEGIAQ